MLKPGVGLHNVWHLGGGAIQLTPTQTVVLSFLAVLLFLIRDCCDPVTPQPAPYLSSARVQHLPHSLLVSACKAVSSAGVHTRQSYIISQNHAGAALDA